MGRSDKVAVNIDAVYMAYFVNVKQTSMNVLYTATVALYSCSFFIINK